MSAWTWLLPAASIILLAVAGAVGPVGPALAALCGIGLGGAVVAAVHHAEVIAHRVGEPFGTLVLALAVTVIEASLILSMMVAGGAEMAVLPRDTIYAAVMIICNGVVGLCLLLGGLSHREQSFRIEGAGSGMAALIVMAALTLAVPAFTTSAPGGAYTATQLLFRRHDLGAVVGDLRLHPDRQASRLLPAGGRRRGPARARAASHCPRGVDQLRAPSRLARGGGRARQGPVADD
jgi:Ca2+:H+ antiporter